MNSFLFFFICKHEQGETFILTLKLVDTLFLLWYTFYLER